MVLDPVSLGLVAGGGLLSAGGSIAGGLLGQEGLSNNDLRIAGFTPGIDRANVGATFDSLGQIGFADPSSLLSAGPSGQLLNRVNALSVDEKSKRLTLQGIDELFSGRNVTHPDIMYSILARIGVTEDQIPQLIESQRAYETQVSDLVSQVPGLQTDIIRNRLAAFSGLSDTAAGLATGSLGESVAANQFANRFREQRSQGINDAEEALLLRAQYGGFAPDLTEINRARSSLNVDADIAGFERALLAASSAQSLLNAGTQAAQGAASIGNQANLGALGIAAQQSQAANSLQAQARANSSTALANGIAGGLSGLGSTLGSLGVLGGLGGLGGGVGSTAPGAGGSASTSPAGGGSLDFINSVANNGFAGTMFG